MHRGAVTAANVARRVQIKTVALPRTVSWREEHQFSVAGEATTVP